VLRSLAGFVYGIVLVAASVVVGAGGYGFVTFFGLVGAPFSFFAVTADKIAFVGIPLFWATVAFMAASRRASAVFLALIGLHYVCAGLWLVLRPWDLTATVAAMHTLSPIATGAGILYVIGQVLLWRDFVRRT
jgi:hypothetical protein